MNVKRKGLILMMVTCVFIALGLYFAYIRHSHNYLVQAPGIRTGGLTMFDNQAAVRPTTPMSKANKKSSTSGLKNETHETQMDPSDNIHKPKPKPPCYRQIQHWIGSKTHQDPGSVEECPGLDCGVRFVVDSTFETMRKSHVVLHNFHQSKWDWAEMQKRRPPHQAWVFFAMEAHTFPPKEVRHLYNYTATHRPSSTFCTPYGYYDKTTPEIAEDDRRNWAQGRPNMVAWAASNCKGTSWKRFDFVKKLSEHIQVDIYGGCGKRGCIRRSESCWKRLRTYKFYLALENSECRDYITEKFWENSLQHDLLPIVYGPPREDYERVAPPNSFIHLQDFRSMRELVDYLNLVGSNDTLYNSFFKWKRHGSLNGSNKPSWHCQILAKFLAYEQGSPRGISREGANSTIYDLWPKQCAYNTSGFPHDF